MKKYIIIELVYNEISNRVETTGKSFEDIMSRYDVDYEEAIDSGEIEIEFNTLNWENEDERIIVVQLD
jgi:hypothetical protein